MTALLRLSATAIVLAGGTWSWTPEGPRGMDVSSAASAVSQRSWTEADLWLAPDRDPNSPTSLERAVELLAADRPDQALPVFVSAKPDPALAPYVELHQGRAVLALDRAAEAAAAARRIIAAAPGGHLGESALWLLAESLEKMGEWTDAVDVWQTLGGLPVANPATVQLRLAQAGEKAGDRALAGMAYARVFYERPTSPEAREAETALVRFPVARGMDTVRLELTRADRLYDARQFADASRTWEQVHARTTGTDRLRVDLRLAQCDIHLQRYARGLTALTSYLARAGAPSKDEAGYFVLTALRGLKRADYASQVARFVRDHPASPFAESALNDLATHYVLADNDARAAEVFTEMYARFPAGGVRGSCGLACGLVGVPESRLSRDGASLRVGGHEPSSRRQPTRLALLDGTFLRGARAARLGPDLVSQGPGRLQELLLRPRGRACVPCADRGARARISRRRRARSGARRRRRCPSAQRHGRAAAAWRRALGRRDRRVATRASSGREQSRH